jgi:hypothetical protein
LLWRIRVRHLAWYLPLGYASLALPHLGFGIQRRLPLCRVMRLCDLQLLTSSCCLSHRRCIRASGRLHSLCRRDLRSLFRIPQSSPGTGLRDGSPLCVCSIRSPARGIIRGHGCSLSLGLGPQRLLSLLLSSAMSQLRAILSSRRREIAVLRSMEIRPGVKDCHIFRRLRDRALLKLVYAVRIHK